MIHTITISISRKCVRCSYQQHSKTGCKITVNNISIECVHHMHWCIPDNGSSLIQSTIVVPISVNVTGWLCKFVSVVPCHPNCAQLVRDYVSTLTFCYAGKSITTRTTCCRALSCCNKGNNKITELRTILQRESQNS